MSSAPFSVIIPAHNEANVIGRCLAAIYESDDTLPRPEVLVVANGCTDKTAEVARNAAPEAKVFELDQGSKTAALNFGRSKAAHTPQIFLDADVECSLRSLTALAETLLKGSALAAIPLANLELSQTCYSVRAYYRVWQKQPFASKALGGSGCYALSEEALSKIGPLPDLIADDFWALSRFLTQERTVLSVGADGQPVFSRVHPPRTLLGQIRVEARRRLGTEQVRREFPSEHMEGDRQLSLLPELVGSGAAPLDALIFIFTKLASKLLCSWRRFRGKERHWIRDESSRQASKTS